MSDQDDVIVREAAEEDLEGILAVFEAIYGSDYPYRSFTDPTWLKRSVYGDDIVMLAALDADTKRVLGSASVVLDVGATTDLIGEFGRLVVHPDARKRGVGRRLMEARLAFVEQRLHVGVVENRCTHPYSQMISHRHGFVPVGFLPLKHRFAERENVALFARHFGNALRLRRNNPRIVPEAHSIAHLALHNCGIEPDCIIDEDATAYPRGGEFRVEELTARSMPAVLRIERGRVRRREVFGPMRLQYGFFKLSARSASYLIAHSKLEDTASTPVIGGIGFIHDEVERSVRVFELIAGNDEVIFVLWSALLERCRKSGVEYIDVDVSAHAPRMQRTLVELGFVPSAFVPAMVFHDVERLDVIKMSRVLLDDARFGHLELIPSAQVFADTVTKNITRQHVLPRLQEAIEDLELFNGLQAEQQARVAAQCQVVSFDEGSELFHMGEPADRMFVIIEGEATIHMPKDGSVVGEVGPGELVGERALLVGEEHSATAVAHQRMVAASLSKASMDKLTRRRPDIGMILYRNLALALGSKLQRMHAWVNPDEDLAV